MKECCPVAVRQPFPDFEHVRFKGEQYKRSPIVSYTINGTGEVTGVKLQRSSGVRDLDRDVLKAVRKWKYNSRPGCPDDVEVTMSLTIHFR